MFCVKVKKNEAETARKELASKCMLNVKYKFTSDNDFVYIPVIEDINDYDILKQYTVVKKEFSPYKETPQSLKTALEKNMKTEELKKIKTSYDQIGDVAVLEVDKNLRNKELKIARTLLNINKNISTVVRKDNAHLGLFRIQKFKYLAGKKKSVTIHKENNVKIKVDINKVYYSPRLSTERKRIASFVKPGEDVLVMFSGCAPYPCVIAKNAKPRMVYGVEINPDGHKCGMENVKLNKLNNVFLINGSIQKIIPKFYQSILGLKSHYNPKQLKKILVKYPQVIELHTFKEDLFSKRKNLEAAIINLKKMNIPLFIHFPLFGSKGQVHMSYKNFTEAKKIIEITGEICRKYDINAIIHPCGSRGLEISEDELIERIKYFKKYFDYFYFETTYNESLFKDDKIIEIIKKTGIKNVCIDIAHLFIEHKSTDRILKLIKKIQVVSNTYFHISNTDGKTDALNLRTGKIKLEKILPIVTYGIVEVRSRNEDFKKEMLESYEFLKNFVKKFDRIVMPAPHNADKFLKYALPYVKSGGFVHYYCFSHENKFNKIKEKIKKECKKAGKKCIIKNIVKCGQHAPYIVRVCADFQVW